MKRRFAALAATLTLALSSPSAAETDAAAARAAFARAVPVFQHPRCVNCHTRAEGPRAGNTPRPHIPPVLRGAAGRGDGAEPCGGCHKDRNTAGGSIPGAPTWRMPEPGRSGWDGLTPAQICAALKDPARNSRLSPDQMVEHMTRDPLVLWAWEPGGIRTKPPLAHADFVALLRAWYAGGAPCPG